MKIMFHNWWPGKGQFFFCTMNYNDYGVLTGLKHEINIDIMNFGVSIGWGG